MFWRSTQGAPTLIISFAGLGLYFQDSCQQNSLILLLLCITDLMLKNFKGAGPHFYLCVTAEWEQLLGTPGRTWDLAAGLGQALLFFGVPAELPAVPERGAACWAGLVVGTAFTLTQFLEETFHTCLFAMYHVEILLQALTNLALDILGMRQPQFLWAPCARTWPHWSPPHLVCSRTAELLW